MLISSICIILAAICNAVMDRVENENFFVSIFKKLNQKFWYKRESWKYAKKIFGWKFDSWHVSKSLMICILLIPISNNIIEYIIYGILWNIIFLLFYKKIFKNEKKVSMEIRKSNV